MVDFRTPSERRADEEKARKDQERQEEQASVAASKALALLQQSVDAKLVELEQRTTQLAEGMNQVANEGRSNQSQLTEQVTSLSTDLDHLQKMQSDESAELRIMTIEQNQSYERRLQMILSALDKL